MISLALTVLFVGISWAKITSYGRISGKVIVNQSITWDILETYSDISSSATNDTYYELETTYQGETKWVKIKIKNAADVNIPVNLDVSINSSDVNTSIWDVNKTVILSNPISIPSNDLYVWIKHEFSPSAALGEYFITLDVSPVS